MKKLIFIILFIITFMIVFNIVMNYVDAKVGIISIDSRVNGTVEELKTYNGVVRIVDWLRVVVNVFMTFILSNVIYKKVIKYFKAK